MRTAGGGFLGDEIAAALHVSSRSGDARLAFAYTVAGPDPAAAAAPGRRAPGPQRAGLP
ncbi:MAG: hypothetical protein ACR2F6_15860 [Mycobacteriales bacterium]